MSRQEMINSFHSKLIQENGSLDGFHISGWSSKKSQIDRFDALLRTTRFSGGSVVDYGCGAGDLYEYLLASGHKFSYIGLDQNERMIDIAKAKYGDYFANINIDEIDFGLCDYVFISGVFQFVDEERPDYYISIIEKLFSSCRIALAANFLSSERKKSNKVFNELYVESSNVLEIAQRMTKFWMIDHSYHLGYGDMTLGLHRQSIISEWQRPSTSEV